MTTMHSIETDDHRQLHPIRIPWCNDSDIILQVKKVLLNAFTLRGRCSRVVLVCEVDEIINATSPSRTQLFLGRWENIAFVILSV